MRPIAAIGRKGLIVNRVSSVDASGPSLFYLDSSTGDKEIGADFESYVTNIYKTNGIVAACIAARMRPFSEVRFQMQDIVNGRPGKLSNDTSLNILDTPWPKGTTGQLLARMEQDASLAGNFYATVVNGHIRRLRPDWVTIITGVRGEPDASPFALAAEIVGYIYDPKDGKMSPQFLSTDAVVHYAPDPDPAAQWRGMSWITPVLDEIQADSYATRHKKRFFEKGATLGAVFTYDKTINPTQFQEYVRLFKEQHEGSSNAYKTLHMGGGADVKVIGTDLKSIDFKATQGAGETRIAAAAGVGAIIARFSEGLAGSSLNAGNYSAAKRQFADMTLRPLWRSAAASLQMLTKPGPQQRLWYDARDVEFLKEDRNDAADIQTKTALTMKTLLDAGYTPDSVTTAVETGDFAQLAHSGLYSVQLQAPGADLPKALAAIEALKAGARNSASDLALIQTAHDAIAAAGATCT